MTVAASLLPRRDVLRGGVALGLAVACTPAFAQPTPAALAAIRAFTGGATPAAGRVALEIATLIDNGNAVPVVLSMASPTTPADHVRRLALFTERNPQPEVAVFALGPRTGRATVSTRMRLATSQRLHALAETSDGRFWQQSVDVIVTLAACLEG